ncbi:MAG: isocitrate/isopropylmalate family dehydrogenase [Methanothrix sp.]
MSSAAMMMQWRGMPENARQIEEAVQKALESGAKAPDLGGRCGTADVTRAAVKLLGV